MKKSIKRALIAGALIAAPAAINHLIFSRAKPLGNPLGGEGRFFHTTEGDIFYARKGKGDKSVVLLHGIYAGASLYEWRKNFDALSEHFSLHAVDLLGFGLSDKPKITYTSDLYVSTLIQFLESAVEKPCAVVASSLTAAYAIEIAGLRPDLIQSLVLVCPTGMTRLTNETSSPVKDAAHQLVGAPLLGTSLYNMIASRASVRSYLETRVYFDPSYVTEEMIDHYSSAAHQYGSQYALLDFVSGQLGHSVRETFPRLRQETIRLIWGREAQVTPLSDAQAFLAGNSRAELTIFDKAGTLPHDEQASGFNRLVTQLVSR